jgi:hypothetical protein
VSISRVQSAQANSSSLSVSNLTVSFAATGAGNFLLLVIAYKGLQTTTMPSGWAQVFITSSGSAWLEMWVYVNNPGGISSLTPSFSSPAKVSLTFVEYSGVDTVAGVDTYGSGNGSSTTASATTTASIAATSDFVIGAACVVSAGSSVSFSTDSGYSVVGTNFTGVLAAESTVQENSSPGVGTASFATTLGISSAWVCGVLAILEAGTAAIDDQDQSFSSSYTIPDLLREPSLYFQIAQDGLDYTPDTSPDIYLEAYLPPRFTAPTFRVIQPDGTNPDAPLLYSMQPAGQYRIQNLSAQGYLLYVGVNAMPDFTQPASQFSATLPLALNWPLPGSQNVTLSVVPRLQDSWGCISQNSNPWTIVLTPTGLLNPPIAAPQNCFAGANPDASVSVGGQYPGFSTDTDPANMVYVWVSTSGPPSAIGPPSFMATLTQPLWSIQFGNYSPNTTVYIAVGLYRSSDGALSGIVQLEVSFPPLPTGPQAVFSSYVVDPTEPP